VGETCHLWVKAKTKKENTRCIGRSEFSISDLL
jgi:hypothetical protein